MSIRVGDIVSPLSPVHMLRSGAAYYADAVCVSLEPFILISRMGDMLWKATVTKTSFASIA